MNNQKCIYQFNNKSSFSFNIPGCQLTSDQFQKPVCYGFWKLNETSTDNKFIFLAKGCWGKDPNLCKTKLFNSTILFCCCTGEYCNRNLNANQCLAELNRIKNIKFTIDLLSILIALIIIPIAIFFLIKLFNRKKNSSFKNQSNGELEKLLINHNQIELLEQRARGRYGDIYRAKLLNQQSNLIAVKIFKKEDYQSFKNELKIYKLKDMKHINILKFITDLETTGIIINQIQYWLITEYKQNGSLQEYLFNNLLNDKQTIQISLDISNGLSYLHGYNCSNYRQIAHRDFKSSNILLSGDLRACIADFGLALVFYNHKLETDTLNLNLVGTFRYFSPELLDGAINFCGDSLLKVDIYACALVFWEILTRNNRLHEQNKIKDYKLPYELELGSTPAINELRNHVSFKQRRPIIEQHWREDKFFNSFCRIIDDSWEYDAETRLTASCIRERLNFMQNYLNRID